MLSRTAPIGISLFDIGRRLVVSAQEFRENQFQLALNGLASATYILGAEYYGIVQDLKFLRQS